MTHSQDRETNTASAPGEDWLERLLREDAARAPHLEDGGFSARVMASLPPPRKPAARWLVPAMTALGTAAAVCFTPAGDFLLHHYAALLDWRHLSFSQLLALVPVAFYYGFSFAALRD
jgi:hypothetical protein